MSIIQSNLRNPRFPGRIYFVRAIAMSRSRLNPRLNHCLLIINVSFTDQKILDVENFKRSKSMFYLEPLRLVTRKKYKTKNLQVIFVTTKNNNNNFMPPAESGLQIIGFRIFPSKPQSW